MIFEDSPLGLDKWLAAVWLVVNCKNGISSYEMARDLGVTQKSAWFMNHRIRPAIEKCFDPRRGGLSKTAHHSIDSCQHDHCVECSHQKPQLRNPHACRLHNGPVRAAVANASKWAMRRERSSGSIAEPAGICGPNQQRRRKTRPAESGRVRQNPNGQRCGGEVKRCPQPLHTNQREELPL
jgi:hypothetical protein